MDGFPIGFRFRPKDGELIFHYLGKRIKNESLPHYGIIHDVSLYNYTPDQLTAMFYNYGEAEWYFFTSREKKYRNGSRPDRAVGEHGYWKPSGKDQPVNLDDNINIIVGSKRTLCFFQGKQPNGVKTSWKMQEYIADPLLFPPNQTIRNNCNNNGDDGMRLDDWVICKIYKSSHHEEKKGKGEEKEGYSNEAFTTSSSQPSPFHQVNHIMSSINDGGFFPALPPPFRIVSHVSPPPASLSQIPHGMASTNVGFVPSSSPLPSSQIPHGIMASNNNNNNGGFLPPPSSQIPHHGMASTNGPTDESPPFQSGEEDDVLALESLLFPSTSNNYNNIYMQESVNYYSGGFENNMVFGGREFHYYQEASSSTNINNPPLEDEDNLNFDPSSLDNPPDNIE